MSRQLLRTRAKAELKRLKSQNKVHKNMTMAAFWPIFVATGKLQAKLDAAKNRTSNIQVLSDSDLDALDFSVDMELDDDNGGAEECES